jgi:hypothetical protein
MSLVTDITLIILDIIDITLVVTNITDVTFVILNIVNVTLIVTDVVDVTLFILDIFDICPGLVSAMFTMLVEFLVASNLWQAYFFFFPLQPKIEASVVLHLFHGIKLVFIYDILCLFPDIKPDIFHYGMPGFVALGNILTAFGNQSFPASFNLQ